ncbi:MAG: SUF system Fe-S cluster assembly protein [Acidobacteriota bacterium]
MSGKDKLEKAIIDVIKTVYDPEIPLNIYDLGLIYKIDIDEKKNVRIEMTLTSPNCPVADSMPNEVGEKVGNVEGVKSAYVELVWDPPFNKDMMSEEARLLLGIF